MVTCQHTIVLARCVARVVTMRPASAATCGAKAVRSRLQIWLVSATDGHASSTQDSCHVEIRTLRSIVTVMSETELLSCGLPWRSIEHVTQ